MATVIEQVGALHVAVYGGATRTESQASNALWVLLQALDGVEQGIAIHDQQGHVQYSNHAYREATGPQSGGEVLKREIRGLALSICALAYSTPRTHTSRATATHIVTSTPGEYRLRGTFIASDLLGPGPSVLVTVDLPHPDRITVERLCAEHRLTRAQARVARWLVQGLRNAEIAQRLFISEHTVRHHVEQIRAKVGGHTRGATAARLQRLS